VDGRIIPGVTAVTDEPPELQLATLKTDARTGPDARLTFYPDTDYMLRLAVPTTQQSVLSVILGRGSEILDRAAANTNNQVGTIAVPTAVSHALFGIAKVSGTTGDFDIEIARFPHADMPFTTHVAVPPVPGTVYDYAICIYNPTTDAFALCDVAPIGGTIAVVDAYLGNVTISGMSLAGGQLFQYDPATSGLVTLGGETVTVDPTLVDPDLRDGDWCVIYSLAYTYSQLSRDGDWQVTQPLAKPTRCVIDLYRSLSDVIDFRVWERRRYYYCEQYNLPAASTTGANTDPNMREYTFVVRPHTPRLGSNGRYYDTQYLVADA